MAPQIPVDPDVALKRCNTHWLMAKRRGPCANLLPNSVLLRPTALGPIVSLRNTIYANMLRFLDQPTLHYELMFNCNKKYFTFEIRFTLQNRRPYTNMCSADDRVSILCAEPIFVHSYT